MYIYTYIYLHIFNYVYKHTHEYQHTKKLHKSIHITCKTCTGIRLQTNNEFHLFFMEKKIYIYMFTWNMFTDIHIYTYIHAHIYIWSCVYVNICIFIRVHVYTCVCVYLYIYVMYTYILIHTCPQICRHVIVVYIHTTPTCNRLPKHYEELNEQSS